MSTSEPLVCAVMLTRDRPAMARRAVKAFRAQTYENKRLLIVNSGPHGPLLTDDEEGDMLREPCLVGIDALGSIGALRNLACKIASHHYAERSDRPGIIVHWDDDDWSHPNRIAEQVALLQSSGADLVGYRELLFWDTRQAPDGGEHRASKEAAVITTGSNPVAWLYQSHRADHVLGTSFCYWRRTWERKKFADLPKGPAATGEDWTFLQGLKVASETAIAADSAGPRMIASIHPGNSSQAYDPENHPREWRRAPEWDEYCRERMTL